MCITSCDVHKTRIHIIRLKFSQPLSLSLSLSHAYCISYILLSLSLYLTRFFTLSFAHISYIHTYILTYLLTYIHTYIHIHTLSLFFFLSHTSHMQFKTSSFSLVQFSRTFSVLSWFSYILKYNIIISHSLPFTAH